MKKWCVKRGWSKSSVRWASEAIIDIATALTLTTNGQDYRREHSRDHQQGMLGTLRDPDDKQLHDWGLWAGMRPGEFRRHLLRPVFSPVWHANFLLARLRSNLAKGKPYRRVAGLFSLAMLGSLAVVLPWQASATAILIP